MLSQLYIKNIAVISEAVIDFGPRFNVFTGETGAGKTILVSAINGVLGARLTKDIIRSGEDSAYLSALFTKPVSYTHLAGKELDALSLNADKRFPVKTTFKDGNCCVSGLQNQCEKLLKQGESKENIARFCIDSVCKIVWPVSYTHLKQFQTACG